MSSNQVCQLFIDPPADGVWNMAVDEMLLNRARSTGEPVLRFYQWQVPTLSLGYFQRAADRSKHPASSCLELVRRMSGGGAIVHDCELTYSLVLPAAHELSRDAQSLYDKMHESIRETLTELLVEAKAARVLSLNERPSKFAAKDEPFLCFERRSLGDILLTDSTNDSRGADYKVVGSAQRRRQGTVLQHGSILLGQSSAAPELEGLAELTGVGISPDDLLERLMRCVEDILQLRLQERSLSQDQRDQATELQFAKYSQSEWTDRR